MKTALVVDDQANVRRLIRDYLTQEGFRVVEAENGAQALLAARRERPDVILLDIMMPEMNGYDTIRAYRREGSAPIILLTARQDEAEKVLGLELGADDYVTKPFGMRELVARIHAVLRRVAGRGDGGAVEDETLRAADITLDRATHAVAVAGRVISLTPSEFELLATLMRTPGRVYSRAQLLERLTGDEGESFERTIDTHIRNLRAKIEPTPAAPIYIETVFGVGYRFRNTADQGK